MSNNDAFYGQSKNAEQYTPREWWERVIKALNGIDCSLSEFGGQNV